MPLFDTLACALLRLLRLVFWTATVLLGLSLLASALVVLGVWLLVLRLLGRSPAWTLSARMADWQRMAGHLQAAGHWPRRSAHGVAEPASGHAAEGSRPLARRAGNAQGVTDVQARELPPSQP